MKTICITKQIPQFNKSKGRFRNKKIHSTENVLADCMIDKKINYKALAKEGYKCVGTPNI